MFGSCNRMLRDRSRLMSRQRVVSLVVGKSQRLRSRGRSLPVSTPAQPRFESSLQLRALAVVTQEDPIVTPLTEPRSRTQ